MLNSPANVQGSLVALGNGLAMAHSSGFDYGVKEAWAAPTSPRFNLTWGPIGSEGCQGLRRGRAV